ncbi:MAG TPA: O-antigen ligase family protein [Bacteroidia bacterium]|nr:O-antigen ligase family protein [Bacteroidia bacterium]
MLNRTQTGWFYAIGGLFIAANAIAVLFDFLFVPLLPVALAVVLMALFAYDKLLYFVTGLVPFSIPVWDIVGGFGLILPTEPVIILLMLIGLLRFANNESATQTKELLRHPLTIAILINLAWLIITSATSSMPLVSFKYTLSRIWYLVVFYFMTYLLFTNYNRIEKFLWWFAIPLSGVVVYVMVRHSQHGFIRDVYPYMIQPFFWVHGVYSATVAMFTPMLIVFFLRGKKMGYSTLTRFFIGALAVLFLFSITYSYTRAAWLSLMGALAALAVFYLKIPIRLIFTSVIIVLLGILIFQKDIMLKLSENEQGSSRRNDLGEHLQSVSNIKNDPSNLERINRWNSALRMFEERPMLGWGPGTYAFQYAPFQRSKDLTIISTNFGDVGHAHSEYLGPLAESGFIGMISWLVVFLLSVYKGMRLFYYSIHEKTRTIALAVLLGLITYYVHGVLNSYIDYDKIAVPLWGFCAILVALERLDAKPNAVVE